MIFGYICLAVLTGAVLGANRTINGRLSIESGPFKASLWNHVVGFSFLTIVLLVSGRLTLTSALGAPSFAYLGGVLGSVFVAINSYVLSRIGAIRAVLLVISGQMTTGLLIDHRGHTAVSTLIHVLGVAVIMVGIYLSKISSAKAAKEDGQLPDTPEHDPAGRSMVPGSAGTR
jgi:bacterial/archaeal transporter family-2 protein